MTFGGSKTPMRQPGMGFWEAHISRLYLSFTHRKNADEFSQVHRNKYPPAAPGDIYFMLFLGWSVVVHCRVRLRRGGRPVPAGPDAAAETPSASTPPW